MIELAGLAKSFGAVSAVQCASFTAPDGAITALLGANGSGKTSTLSMVMGLLKADAGTARVDGIDVRDSPREVRRRIGWFPDAFGLYPRLTAREHVRYFGELHRMKEQAIGRTLGELERHPRPRTEGFSTGSG